MGKYYWHGYSACPPSYWSSFIFFTINRLLGGSLSWLINPKETKGVTQMNMLKTSIIVVISMVFIAGLPACEKKNSAEVVGEKIDETAEEAGDILNEKITD